VAIRLQRIPLLNRLTAKAGREAEADPDSSDDEVHRIGLVVLSILAVMVGTITGLGAVAFRALIGLIHNVFFLGEWAVHYDANLFTPASPWGMGVILVPVAGAIIVTFLVSTFAPEAKGHGVPEVMDAIYYKGGIIRPVVAVVKSLSSAFAIGSGAAVGREGPIIQIGAALGSTLGQIVHMPPGERIILVAAGAGAGIASTFNTPLGGVMFAIELMMPEISARTFLPVAVATGTATFIGRFFFGDMPAFSVPELTPIGTDGAAVLLLCLYAVLGGITGIAAAGFVRGLHMAEDLFDRIKGRYTRHILGMALVGVMIYLLQAGFGHYFVEGVGYSTIQAILLGNLSGMGLMLLLFLCKMAATSLSLGSGSSGGIFSPSLFMGATIGGAFAAGVSLLGLPFAVNVPAFAMVGMGAMVGGGTGAAMAAVTMIFEMTLDYGIVLPLILAVAVSVGVRRLLSPENIYTLKLVRRGRVMPKALHANMFLVRRAKEVMDTDLLVVAADMRLEDFLAAHADYAGRMCHVAVAENNRILGAIRFNMALPHESAQHLPGLAMRDIATRKFTLVHEDDIAFDVIRRMWRKQAAMALVVRKHGTAQPDDLVGVITKEHVADSVANSVSVYPT